MKLAKSILHCCGITHRLVTMIARSAPFSMGQMAWSQSRCQVTAMTSAWGRLHIEVRDGEIFVTLPGTSYRAVYHKHAAKLGLIATSRFGRWEQGVPTTQKWSSALRQSPKMLIGLEGAHGFM